MWPPYVLEKALESNASTFGIIWWRHMRTATGTDGLQIVKGQPQINELYGRYASYIHACGWSPALKRWSGIANTFGPFKQLSYWSGMSKVWIFQGILLYMHIWNLDADSYNMMVKYMWSYKTLIIIISDNRFSLFFTGGYFSKVMASGTKAIFKMDTNYDMNMEEILANSTSYFKR